MVHFLFEVCILVSYIAWGSSDHISRALLMEPEQVHATAATIKSILQPPNKMDHLRKLIGVMEPVQSKFLDIKFDPTSRPLQPTSHTAIIAAALSTTFISRDVAQFVGTARRTGYHSEIVVAVLPNSDPKFLARLTKYNVTIFTVSSTCTGKQNILCTFQGRSDMPVTLMRYWVYQFIAEHYSSHTKLLISDFRDIFFQSNPFKNKWVTGLSKPNEILLFQEAHPNRVINRDSQNSYYISLCYGTEVGKNMGTNTISTAGMAMGSRDAIMAYSYLITTQYRPELRTLFNDTIPDPNNCLRFGVDMGFHNVLLYGHVLEKFLDVRLFQQGEGPMNSIGGFHGENKLLRAYLSEWKILRGEAPYKYIYNWNGEMSPVVHQLDRYLNTELKGGYAKHMAAFQHIYE